MAMLCGLSQSAKRIKGGVEAMPDNSKLKKLVSPISDIMTQKGMDDIHTPSHYSSCMPGLSLLGRTLVAVGSNKGLSFKMEDLFFPGFGGLELSDDVQLWHQRKTQSYFDTKVQGASFSEKWYSLTKLDQHILLVPSWKGGKMKFVEFLVPGMKITSSVLVAFVAAVFLASSGWAPKTFSWNINSSSEISLRSFFSTKIPFFKDWISNVSEEQSWPKPVTNDSEPVDKLALLMKKSWGIMNSSLGGRAGTEKGPGPGEGKEEEDDDEGDEGDEGEDDDEGDEDRGDDGEANKGGFDIMGEEEEVQEDEKSRENLLETKEEQRDRANKDAKRGAESSKSKSGTLSDEVMDQLFASVSANVTESFDSTADLPLVVDRELSLGDRSFLIVLGDELRNILATKKKSFGSVKVTKRSLFGSIYAYNSMTMSFLSSGDLLARVILLEGKEIHKEKHNQAMISYISVIDAWMGFN